MTESGLFKHPLSAGELANIDKQTARLKKNRAKIQANRRAKDGFDVR
jgi:hypothetical protein